MSEEDISKLKYLLDRSRKALEPFAKQLEWKYGKYINDLPIIANSPCADYSEEMSFKLGDFRNAHIVWELLNEKNNKDDT